MHQKRTAEVIIKMLAQDERNYISEYWAGKMPGKEGSHTGGITINCRNPYWTTEGLCSWDNWYISAAELESVKDVCEAEPWGGNVLGGIEYRLKSELRKAA
ncbi:TPA: hypothetical protein ACSRV8_003851 [Enterobacter hormaechei subsp. steigerwaltii]|uniref:hypothetical protein n=1 Tax=Enterobacter hormaechei TaxID=158836 RepID=UPI0015D51D2D|nr:hypothetical protein [Enterobacter hormaechei]MCU3541950.1 hypothetical protein [Enterobacter hormaechei subsp. steigerwaltii]MBG0529392.1 hypothetical protein [Enterobacter hormaechei]MBK4236916.1 hypothetical protein [Enterobacter hormaechei]HCD1589072.1 hypothetical protein [Enterobacter hormaechei]HDS5157217.1 hypothetical protein [Enterobacter hormaechei subsp. steigerwaltii]